MSPVLVPDSHPAAVGADRERTRGSRVPVQTMSHLERVRFDDDGLRRFAGHGGHPVPRGQPRFPKVVDTVGQRMLQDGCAAVRLHCGDPDHPLSGPYGGKAGAALRGERRTPDLTAARHLRQHRLLPDVPHPHGSVVSRRRELSVGTEGDIVHVDVVPLEADGGLTRGGVESLHEARVLRTFGGEELPIGTPGHGSPGIVHHQVETARAHSRVQRLDRLASGLLAREGGRGGLQRQQDRELGILGAYRARGGGQLAYRRQTGLGVSAATLPQSEPTGNQRDHEHGDGAHHERAQTPVAAPLGVQAVRSRAGLARASASLASRKSRSV